MGEKILAWPIVRQIFQAFIQAGYEPGSLNPFLDERRAVDLGADQNMLGTLPAHSLDNPFGVLDRHM
jgi:hypothetical protein